MFNFAFFINSINAPSEPEPRDLTSLEIILIILVVILFLIILYVFAYNYSGNKNKNISKIRKPSHKITIEQTLNSFVVKIQAKSDCKNICLQVCIYIGNEYEKTFIFNTNEIKCDDIQLFPIILEELEYKKITRVNTIIKDSN